MSADPSPMLEVAHVLFMDVVAYSILPMEKQRETVQDLQDLVRRTPQFTSATAKKQVISLPTGDGMALVFSDNAEAPVQCALEIVYLLQKSGSQIKLRMGIHAGPVYRGEDINLKQNFTGAGINLAQRVMDCGDAGHILISKAAADLLNQVSRWRTGLHDLGEAEVKHGERIHLFNFYTEDAGNSTLPRKLQAAEVSTASETPRMPAGRMRVASDADEHFVKQNQGRSIDEWYRVINAIYWNRNLYRDNNSIFAHFIETIGGLSLLASQKKKPGLVAEVFVSKATAWWMALCGKLRVKSVAEMVWAKFPHVCPYCLRCPHEPDECSERKMAGTGLDWDWLERAGRDNVGKRPVSLGAWQRMFSAIYPVQQTEEYSSSFARCTEELGELAEALRVFPEAPDYFLNEAADVFAWLMHIRNLIDSKRGTPKRDRGVELETEFCKAYPDRCLDCGQATCDCPPILKRTIGRLAHELTGGREYFMTPDRAQAVFQPRR
jgi:class 3 adenylate cyclase/NTP pyrophosphatase (non-canonical NTP hydrolase)